MGANGGHQLGLRLWQAPLPRRLHPSGCCARLDRPEHPGLTAPWPMARAWTGSTAAGHPTHAGELVAGKHGSAMGSSCDCVYCPNKQSPFSYWLSTSVETTGLQEQGTAPTLLLWCFCFWGTESYVPVLLPPHNPPPKCWVDGCAPHLGLFRVEDDTLGLMHDR